MDDLDALLTEGKQEASNSITSCFDKLISPTNGLVVLFGAGSLGRQCLKKLRQDGIHPICFTDNNPQLWGKQVDGLAVYSPDEAIAKYGSSSSFVITVRSHESKHRFAETKRIFRSKGCTNVISFMSLLWKYPEEFLPYYYMDLPQKIFDDASRVKQAFRLLADEISEITYITQLKWRTLPDYDALPQHDPDKQYFPDRLFTWRKDEVFVDGGAYTGDTLAEFLVRRKRMWSEIHAFEPDKRNFDKLTEYITSLPSYEKDGINAHPFAMSNKNMEILFSSDGSASSSISESGNQKIQAVALDQFIKGIHPTYVKMDIEGAELDAIKGMEDIIKNDLPVLAICAYHKQNDLWEIPLLINSFSDEYSFFLRAHEDEGWELVYYCVPQNRLWK